MRASARVILVSQFSSLSPSGLCHLHPTQGVAGRNLGDDTLQRQGTVKSHRTANFELSVS